MADRECRGFELAGDGERVRSRRPARAPAGRRLVGCGLDVRRQGGLGVRPPRARPRPWADRPPASARRDHPVEQEDHDDQQDPDRTREVALVEEDDLRPDPPLLTAVREPGRQERAEVGHLVTIRSIDAQPGQVRDERQRPVEEEQRGADPPDRRVPEQPLARVRSRAPASPPSNRCSGRCWPSPGRARGRSGCRPGSRTGSGSGSPPRRNAGTRSGSCRPSAKFWAIAGRRPEVAPQLVAMSSFPFEYE